MKKKCIEYLNNNVLRLSTRTFAPLRLCAHYFSKTTFASLRLCERIFSRKDAKTQSKNKLVFNQLRVVKQGFLCALIAITTSSLRALYFSANNFAPLRLCAHYFSRKDAKTQRKDKLVLNPLRMVRPVYLCALIAITTTFFSCNSTNNSADNTLNTSRIVCVSKQLTELVYALGQQSHLVGTDLTSVYPMAARNLPKVGYHRLLNAEGIISLKPTLVIHDGNVAPLAVLEQLKKVGIPVKEFPEAKTIDDTKKLIHELGDVFNAQKQADSLCTKMDKDFAEAAEKRKQYSDTPRVIVVHFGQQSNRYLVVGKNSTASKLIELAGGKNAIDISKGMGALSAEVVAKAQPDVILATDLGFDEQGTVENFKKLPGIALTPAGINNRIYRISEHDIIYFNPESGEAVMKIMGLIHKK